MNLKPSCFTILITVRVAKLERHPTSNRKTAGSNPVMDILPPIAQLVERSIVVEISLIKTRMVPGSIPGWRIFFI